MYKCVPAATLFVICYINHIFSLYVTRVNLEENRLPLKDLIHDSFEKIDSLYLNIVFCIHIIYFLLFVLNSRYKIKIYNRVSLFLSFITMLRFITITMTYYPNARKCNEPSFGNYCGDMMFSEHTAIAITTYLAYIDYNNKHSIININFITMLASIFLLILTRMHYTNDVVISSYITYITWKYSYVIYPDN